MNVNNIGIIGDGQLAKMLIQAGQKLSSNLNFYVYPIGKPSESICLGLATLVKSYSELCDQSDVITYEFENLPLNQLRGSFCNETVVIPSLHVLEIIQSKSKQKELYKNNQIPTASYQIFPTASDLKVHLDLTDNRDKIIKKDQGGYNGLGVLNLKSNPDRLNDFLNQEGSYILEDLVKIKKEFGVMVVSDGENEYHFEPVEMEFTKDDILSHLHTHSPQLTAELAGQLTDLAKKAVHVLGSKGLFGVELFLTDDDQILINEISPRPHNSGHHTIESARFSQYDQLMRILMGYSVQKNETEEKALMINLLGPDFTGPYELDSEKVDKLLEKGIYIHDYKKKSNRPNRKMGHLTELNPGQLDLEYITSLTEDLIKPLTKPLGKPLVGVIMGSISDACVVKPTIDILKEFGVPHEVGIVSAHRMPKEMYHYAVDSNDNGLKVIIACAGGAAHLPGMVASLTSLPVIGLPAKTSALNGVDSLYSIVQMPSGVPVAAVAINNGINAALLAIRILSIDSTLAHLGLKEHLSEFQKTNNLKSKKSNTVLLEELS